MFLWPTSYTLTHTHTHNILGKPTKRNHQLFFWETLKPESHASCFNLKVGWNNKIILMFLKVRGGGLSLFARTGTRQSLISAARSSLKSEPAGIQGMEGSLGQGEEVTGWEWQVGGETAEWVKVWLGYHIQKAGRIDHFDYICQGEEFGENRGVKLTQRQNFS